MELDPATELTILAHFYLGDSATVSFDQERMVLTLGKRRVTSALVVQNSPRAVQFVTFGQLAAELLGQNHAAR